MATLKEFEEALRQHGMTNALAILDDLKKRDREQRSVAPARRAVGRKMTAELARSILELHATTGMTQQEIAFKLGVNQGRVNEVIKRGKWLSADPAAPEALSRDRAMQRLEQRSRSRRESKPAARPGEHAAAPAARPQGPPALERPDTVRMAKVQASPTATENRDRPMPGSLKPPLRRPASVPGAIVSAQLAFLDL